MRSTKAIYSGQIVEGRAFRKAKNGRYRLTDKPAQFMITENVNGTGFVAFRVPTRRKK